MKDVPEEPRRYADSGGAEGKLLELLSAPPLTDARMARIEERIDALARSPRSGAGVGVLAKRLALLVVVAMPVAMRVWSAEPTSPVEAVAPVVAPSGAPEPPSTAPCEPPPTVDVESLPAVEVSPSTGNEARPLVRASAIDQLARELSLLDQARAHALTDPAAALRDVKRHATEFPDGQLFAEREVIAVDALRRLGRGDAARARGRAFIERSPGSSAARRIESLLDEH